MKENITGHKHPKLLSDDCSCEECSLGWVLCGYNGHTECARNTTDSDSRNKTKPHSWVCPKQGGSGRLLNSTGSLSQPTKTREDSEVTHPSSSRAHQSQGSSCYSSYTGYHSDNRGGQPLEVQSICPCKIRRCWSRGSLIALQETRDRAVGLGNRSCH